MPGAEAHESSGDREAVVAGLGLRSRQRRSRGDTGRQPPVEGNHQRCGVDVVDGHDGRDQLRGPLREERRAEPVREDASVA